jgi:heme a synthase
MSNSHPSGYNPWLHRFAVTTSISTFFLIIAGGLVTSTGSGLAVPDWPLSYGQFMPPMVGGIFYEHGHRMIATFVGILMTTLAIWIWRVEKRRWVKTLALAGLLAVITQGVLGGLTVLYLLPTWISVSHATLAQSFFSLTIVLSLVTSRFWHEHRPEELPLVRKTRFLAVATTGVILLQLVLGGLVRHTDSALAIPDVPLTYGNLLPPFSVDGMAGINQERIEWDLPPVSFGQIWVQFAHRVGALLVIVVALMNVLHVLGTYKDAKLREPAVLLLALMAMQVLLGALTVWTGKGVQIATSHVALGALLLAVSVVLSIRSFQLYRLPAKSFSSTIAAELSHS